jgi:hypothetical protein
MEMINSPSESAYPDKPWDWEGISHNPNLTMEMILEHLDKPWNWNGISKNPNLTMEFIEKNIEKINFQHLSSNNFGWKKDNTLEYYKQRKSQTIKQTELLKEELIAKTWHPARFMDWCIDNEELKDMEE